MWRGDDPFSPRNPGLTYFGSQTPVDLGIIVTFANPRVLWLLLLLPLVGGWRGWWVREGRGLHYSDIGPAGPSQHPGRCAYKGFPMFSDWGPWHWVLSPWHGSRKTDSRRSTPFSLEERVSKSSNHGLGAPSGRHGRRTAVGTLTRTQAERLLRALEGQERQLLQELQMRSAKQETVEKDW